MQFLLFYTSRTNFNEIIYDTYICVSVIFVPYVHATLSVLVFIFFNRIPDVLESSSSPDIVRSRLQARKRDSFVLPLC